MRIKRIILVVALIGLVVAGYFAHFVYSAMFKENTAFANQEACIFITSDATYESVRADLEPLLKNLKTFDALASRKQYTTNIKPGKYCIERGMTNNDIINTIRSKNQAVRVSFNNQPSLAGLSQRISEQIEADSLALYTVMLDSVFLKKNNLDEANALAMYLPNTYEMYWNTSAEGFRDRMLKEYKKFWNESRLQKAKAINLTDKEVLTLASIVYEESKQPSEQLIIAGVYLNRLKSGWPLQADPTLKFAAYKLPQYKNTIIKRVLNVHKEIDSPYNTYMYPGLPPGPVAMPDISAVEAVLNAEQHDYYYFAADAERPGFHRFAKDLAEHNRNAARYQRYLSEQGIRR